MGQSEKSLSEIFDMRPYFIEQRLKLRNPIYSETAAYGHMGRKPEIVEKTFVSPDGKTIKKKVELFTWEKLDYVKKVKQAFKLKISLRLKAIFLRAGIYTGPFLF